MARTQSRRGVSLNREVYAAVMKRAAQDGMSAAELVTWALRQAGVEIPETAHMANVAVQRAIIGKIRNRRRVLNGWVDRG